MIDLGEFGITISDSLKLCGGSAMKIIMVLKLMKYEDIAVPNWVDLNGSIFLMSSASCSL
jgi:hypothetical protein